MEILQNDTISLRALEPEDLDTLYLWENDPSVWHLSGTLVPYSRFVLRQYLENAGKDIFEQKQLRLIIEHRKEKRPLGAIDLFDFDPFNRRAGVGILIATETDRGKGFGHQAINILKDFAFKVLNLHQLWCNVSAENQSSLKLFTSAGFQLVGEKKEWNFTGDSFSGEFLLQCVRDPGMQEYHP